MNRYKFRLPVITVILFNITACHSKIPDVKTKAPFCLTDTLREKTVIDTVKLQVVKNIIALSGKIEANEDKWVKVYPVVGGIVDEMKVQLGDYVTKGQTLAVIRSGEIADYQNQLNSAQSTVRNTEISLNSSRELFKSGLATERDTMNARTDLDKASSDLKRMEQTASIYGVKSNAIQIITAPISGYVIEKNITDKMQYRPDAAQPFFIIANLEEVWVMASVFETDIAKIKTGY
ncbi:MAG TPA: efflux RND transporter periplasmic adaptor subunit, partial [Puia sp.]